MNLNEALQVLEDAHLDGRAADAAAVGASIAEAQDALAVERDGYGIVATFVIGEVPFRMRWVWPGRFLMGSPEGGEGRFKGGGPRHEVTLTRGYWLGETPVTQALWNNVMGKNPSRFEGRERPVEQVNWVDARSFCEALGAHLPVLGLRLPSEAEWEYACRAGTTTATWLGDDDHSNTLDSIAWHRRNSGGATRPVGQKQANPWGFHDMLGNVWEWCADHNGRGWRRMSRGGGWLSSAHHVRATTRRSLEPGACWRYLGFRLAGDTP